MRAAVIILVALSLVAVTGLFLYVCFWLNPPSDGGAQYLAVAGLIVAAAALVSIGAAVLTYVGSEEARRKLREMADSIGEMHKSLQAEAEAKRQAEYEMGIALFQSLERALALQGEPRENDSSIRALRRAEVDLHLARGSYASIRMAIEGGFKVMGTSFLEIEGKLIEKCRPLPKEQAEGLLKLYRALRRLMISRLGIRPSSDRHGPAERGPPRTSPEHPAADSGEGDTEGRADNQVE